MPLVPVLGLEGQWHGWAAVGVVVTAIAIFMGLPYIILSTVLGARKAFLVESAGLFGFIILLSLVWLVGAPGTVPGTGPRGPEPTWVPFLADSEQGQEFAEHIARFPDGWDEPGKRYAGGIDSKSEIETTKSQLLEALANRAAFQGLPATEPSDWNFRVAGQRPATEEEATLPAATVRFFQTGPVLLSGVRIPATDEHPSVTVFALRDKGRIFQPAAMFLGVGVVAFILSLAGLARIEKKEKREAAAPSAIEREPAPTG